MLIVESGVPRIGYALQAEDGTILLSDIDAHVEHAHRLRIGKRIHHPHHGKMTVVPVVVVVTVDQSAGQPSAEPQS